MFEPRPPDIFNTFVLIHYFQLQGYLRGSLIFTNLPHDVCRSEIKQRAIDFLSNVRECV